MMGTNGIHIRTQQEKSYKNFENLFSGNFFAGQCYLKISCDSLAESEKEIRKGDLIKFIFFLSFVILIHESILRKTTYKLLAFRVDKIFPKHIPHAGTKYQFRIIVCISQYLEHISLLHIAIGFTTVTAPVQDGPNKNVLYFKRRAQLN